MDFPRRPSRNEDPWYSARETYDRAIEDAVTDSHRSRSILPDGTDLDILRGPEWHGVWSLPSGNTYPNLPNTFSESVNLEVIRSGQSHSVVHRITAGSGGSPWWSGIYWRESFNASTWHPWLKVVSTTDLESPSHSNAVPRRTLPADTDLDTLTTRATAGVYTLSGGTNYPGLPQTFIDNPFNTRQTLNVYVTGIGGSSYQELIIAGDPSGGGNDRIGTWHRAMNNTGTWFFDWTKLVSVQQLEEMISGGGIVGSNQVRTISVTSNPNQSAQAGELLIVVE